ncbi:MAG: type III pantothenate kinase [Synechococcus sp. BS301-5m-G54]|nr:type III pantothenate kinase [Synechococcus sp. BS301-5m-G54]MBL6796743.1 type III pantothenate kinase [Synechococcus sp. BS307-5m-G34]
MVDPAVCSTGLLIGNSRWHWAEFQADRWHFDHSLPDLSRLEITPPVWAAVGPVPETPFLNKVRRLTLADVPVEGCPPWLGVDRALGAFSAWSRCIEQKLDRRAGVLLADAGTVLSLTLLDSAGGFRGGQLIPGLRMQLQAMAAGASGLDLPAVDVESPSLFPRETDAAMWRGALQALVGALGEAQRQCGALIWLCGGDAARLEPELIRAGLHVRCDPDLVMKGLVDLMPMISPDPDH